MKLTGSDSNFLKKKNKKNLHSPKPSPSSHIPTKRPEDNADIFTPTRYQEFKKLLESCEV